VPDFTTDVPDEPTRAAIVRLARTVEEEDGAPPLSDNALTHLGSHTVQHVLLRDADEVVGYGQREGEAAEVVATRAAMSELVDRIASPGLRIWSHGRRSRLAPVFSEHGFEPVRELHQLRRSLADVPDEPRLPAEVVIRGFEPGRDDEPWLAVNAAAFATHPEQGRWTRDDLAARMAEPWFDPAGFLLADRNGELLGFHWTKVHGGGLGEVYVLGVAPAAQGLGLGQTLLAAGLRHLSEVGCSTVLLYVDGDNPAALRLYEKAGFAAYDLDVQWQSPA
jgi:mycothiol synthase